MATWVETIIDTFNDNLFSTSIWDAPQGTTYIAESGAKLEITGDSSYPYVRTKAKYDLTSNLFAVKWDAGSGTATASSTFILTADDASGNQVILASAPSSNAWQFQSGGSATVSGTLSGTTLGTALAAGTWFGIGMLGSDNILHLYKSTDGVTWTSLGSCTVGGTFVKTKVQFRIQAGHYTGSESPTWASNIDEAAIWAVTPQPRVKVRVGGAWLDAVPKTRVAGAWVVARPRLRVGGSWTTSE